MTHDFDREYWQRHWDQAHRTGPAAGAPNPYLVRETAGLVPGTALDAGCGTGTEASWLAAHGWRVTAADIASEALAAGRAREAGVRWVETDLTTWDPGTSFDLVTTHYAHPAMPQLAFYDRISGWVAPGGTLLIVGHLHAPGVTGHGHRGPGTGPGHAVAAGAQPHAHPPAEASVSLPDITAVLDSAAWAVVTAEEHQRTVTGPGGRATLLHDVVVRATRRVTPGERTNA
jgi:SAM-dependent methyltransferase